MRLLRTFPLAAFALVLLGVVGFCAADGQIGLLLIAGLIAAVSWYTTEGPRGWALPRTFSNLLILAASINVFVDLAANLHDVIGVLGRFAIWITLIKLYERKTRIEYAQLLWLSLLLIIAGAIESRDLLFGIVLLAYSILGMYVLVLYQLYAQHETERDDRRLSAPPGASFVPPVRPVFSGTPGVHLTLSVVVLTIVGLTTAATAFLAFPRGVGMGIFRPMQRQNAFGGSSGVISRVELLTGERITESRARILNLKQLDAGGRVIRPMETLYLRGAAYDRYDPAAARWDASRGLGQPHIAVGSSLETFAPLAELAADMMPPHEYAITPLTNLGGILYAPELPAAVSTASNQALVYHRGTQTLTVVSDPRVSEYRIRSYLFGFADAWPALADPSRRVGAIAAAARVFDPKVRDYALTVLRNADITPPSARDPEAILEQARHIAGVFEAHFHQHFRYTTDLRDVSIAPGKDPIVAFLEDFRRGHCEYFASAMTALCQTVGLEARLVTGFLASEWNADTQSILVRAADAHAWVEVRVGIHAWARFDPSPPTALVARSETAGDFAERIRSWYELFEGGWLERIVNFDSGNQRDLQTAFRLDSILWFEEVVAAVDQWLGRFARRFGAAGTLWIMLVTAAVATAIVIGVQLLRRARRIRRSLHLEQLRGSDYRRMLRQLGFYLDMLDLLRRAGRPKPYWQPPLAFAEQLALSDARAGGSVRDLTRTFYRARYGGDTLTSDDLLLTERLLVELALTLNVRWRPGGLRRRRSGGMPT